MKIEIAKNAGFCFGVDRAVKIAYDCISEKDKLSQNNLADDSLIYTYGMLIHNTDVTNDLAKKGISAIEKPCDAPFFALPAFSSQQRFAHRVCRA